MRKIVLAVILAIGLLSSAQAAFTPGLEISKMQFTRRDDIDGYYRWHSISGVLKNTSKISYSQVYIEVSVKDNQTGEKLQTLFYSYLYNVRPGDKVKWETNAGLCAMGDEIRNKRYTARIERVEGTPEKD